MIIGKRARRRTRTYINVNSEVVWLDVQTDVIITQTNSQLISANGARDIGIYINVNSANV
jgi:hypothetical protein